MHPAVEIFILVLYRRGYWRSLMRAQAADSRKWALHFRSFSNTRSKRSSRSFRPTVWVQTLTTAHTLTPTGCHLLDACGIAAGAGSLGISSEKKRQKLEGRGSGKMMGKQKRSKKASVMETYEMDTTVTPAAGGLYVKNGVYIAFLILGITM